jgi:hypothetical protein
MDKLTRAYYEAMFKVAYLEKGGNAFQDFFSDIMEKCHPGDFQRVRPWGNTGDRKNDGYLRSRRILFQVYAPNEMISSTAIAKIAADFSGALPYWQQYFDKWVFVHNSKNGLGPDILEKLLTLGTVHNPVDVCQWGYEELRQKVFTLDEADLASLLGPAPSSRDMLDVRYDDVQEVLSNIIAQKPSLSQDIRPVPSDKLKCNGLSEDVQTLLTWGMQKADLVEKFFDSHPDPLYGDKIASAFNEKYRRCRALEMEPDKIFHGLLEFAGGKTRGNIAYEAAVYAVLAYLFEQCEIFERSSEEVVI